MRKIVVSEFVSLDNVMQAPGGAEEDTEGGFTHGGWTWPFWHDDIGAHFFEEMSHSDALLLGRKTWQIHGGALSTPGHSHQAWCSCTMRAHDGPQSNCMFAVTGLFLHLSLTPGGMSISKESTFHRSVSLLMRLLN